MIPLYFFVFFISSFYKKGHWTSAWKEERRKGNELPGPCDLPILHQRAYVLPASPFSFVLLSELSKLKPLKENIRFKIINIKNVLELELLQNKRAWLILCFGGYYKQILNQISAKHNIQRLLEPLEFPHVAKITLCAHLLAASWS